MLTVWAFDGIDPEINLGFLVLVDDRYAATLLPLIQQFIAPGSIIHSDEWAAYRNIARMACEKFATYNLLKVPRKIFIGHGTAMSAIGKGTVQLSVDAASKCRNIISV